MSCLIFALFILLAVTSLTAAEPLVVGARAADRMKDVPISVPDQYVFQIKVVEGNQQKKETHKLLGKEVSLTTLKNRASKYNTGDEVSLPQIPGSRVEYVPHGLNILITPLAIDGDTVRLDLQLLKINVVTSNDEEFESETTSRRWNKTVTVGKSNTFVLDKNSEKQTWLELTVLVNRWE